MVHLENCNRAIYHHVRGTFLRAAASTARYCWGAY